MQSLQERLKQMAGEWLSASKAMSDAASKRDFESLNRAFINGRDSFNKVRRLLDGASPEERVSCRELLAPAMDAWRQAGDSLPGWMDEAKRSLESVRRRKSVTGKLSSAYRRKQKDSTGVRLRIKAR